MTYVLGNKVQRRLFFEGNSLFNLKAGNTATTADYNGNYSPTQIYGQLMAAGKVCAYTSFSVSGQTGTQILSAAPTRIIPYIRQGDIVVYWEITNDLFAGVSVAQCYQNIVDYATLVRNAGALLVIGTFIARDYSLDPAGLLADGQTVNSMIRSAGSSLCDVIADCGADVLFDARADCANTTYYQSDKLHLKQAGQDVIIPYYVNAINSIW